MLYKTKNNFEKAMNVLIYEKHYDYHTAKKIADRIFNELKWYRKNGGIPFLRAEWLLDQVVTREEWEDGIQKCEYLYKGE